MSIDCLLIKTAGAIKRQSIIQGSFEIIGSLIGRLEPTGQHYTRDEVISEIINSEGRCFDTADWKASLVGPLAVVKKTRNKLSIYCPSGSGGVVYAIEGGGGKIELSQKETTLYANNWISTVDLNSITQHLLAHPALQCMPFSTLTQEVLRIPGMTQADFYIRGCDWISLLDLTLIYPESHPKETLSHNEAKKAFFDCLYGYMELLKKTPERTSLLLSGGIDSTVFAVAANEVGLDLQLIHRVEKNVNHRDTWIAKSLARKLNKTLLLVDDSDIEKEHRRKKILADAKKGFGQLGTLRSTYYRSMTAHEDVGGIVLDGQNMDSLYGYRIARKNIAFASFVRNMPLTIFSNIPGSRVFELNNKELGFRLGEQVSNHGFDGRVHAEWLENELKYVWLKAAEEMSKNASNFFCLKAWRFMWHGQNSIRMRKIRFGGSGDTNRQLVAAEGGLPWTLLNFPQGVRDLFSKKSIFTEYLNERLGLPWDRFVEQAVPREALTGGEIPIATSEIFDIYYAYSNHACKFQGIPGFDGGPHRKHVEKMLRHIENRQEYNGYMVANMINLLCVLESFKGEDG